jgi:hypothetical protein
MNRHRGIGGPQSNDAAKREVDAASAICHNYPYWRGKWDQKLKLNALIPFIARDILMAFIGTCQIFCVPPGMNRLMAVT